MFYICLERDAVAFFLLYSFGRSLDHGLVMDLPRERQLIRDQKNKYSFLTWVFLIFFSSFPSLHKSLHISMIQTKTPRFFQGFVLSIDRGGSAGYMTFGFAF